VHLPPTAGIPNSVTAFGCQLPAPVKFALAGGGSTFSTNALIPRVPRLFAPLRRCWSCGLDRFRALVVAPFRRFAGGRSGNVAPVRSLVSFERVPASFSIKVAVAYLVGSGRAVDTMV